jgi:membrane protein DedA with SNARE-associated domain
VTLLHLTALATEWLTHYGDYALFLLLALGIIGLPIPDETLLALSGALMASGKLPLIPTLIASLGGALFGITGSYILGRTAGNYLLERYGPRIGINTTKIERTHRWFEKIGKWSLLVGYFIPGIRHLTGYIAGSTKLQFRSFAFFAYAGAFIWSLGILAIGYFFSQHWQKILYTISLFFGTILCLCLLALVIYIVMQIFYRHKKR